MERFAQPLGYKPVKINELNKEQKNALRKFMGEIGLKTVSDEDTDFGITSDGLVAIAHQMFGGWFICRDQIELKENEI